MNKFNRELKPGEQVFRASIEPFIVSCGGVIASIIAICLLGFFAAILTGSGSNRDVAIWLIFAGMIVFLILLGIFCAVFAYRFQFGVIIDDEAISLNQRPDVISIRWGAITEIYHDKSWFGPYQPTTETEEEERAKKSWKEKTTGLRLSLIGQGGVILGRIHSSQYKEIADIANTIETRTTQIQGHPTRDLKKERNRALKKFRCHALFHTLLNLCFLLGWGLAIDYTSRWDAKIQQLADEGIVATATLTMQEPLGREVTIIGYEFDDQLSLHRTEERRVKRKAWEERARSDSIEIIYDPTDSSINQPANIPVDSFITNKTFRGFVIYGIPLFFSPCLLFGLYQFVTQNYHFETDRYTHVKLGKPKNKY